MGLLTGLVSCYTIFGVVSLIITQQYAQCCSGKHSVVLFFFNVTILKQFLSSFYVVAASTVLLGQVASTSVREPNGSPSSEHCRDEEEIYSVQMSVVLRICVGV